MKIKLKKFILYLRDFIFINIGFLFYKKDRKNVFLKHAQDNKSIAITTIELCNADCVFCAYKFTDKSKKIMEMKLFKKIVDDFVSFSGKHINLTPTIGEVLLDKLFMERLEYISSKDKNLSVNFTTNAILLTREVSEKIIRLLGDKGSIVVSFGGFDKEIYETMMGKDKFLQVSQNIRDFVKLKQECNSKIRFEISVRGNSRESEADFYLELKEYEKQGAIYVTYVDLFHNWRGKITNKYLKNFGLVSAINPYKLGSCKLLYQNPKVFIDGDISACHCLDYEKNLIIGNLNSSGIEDVWMNKSRLDLIARQENGDFNDICKKCNVYVSIYNIAYKINN